MMKTKTKNRFKQLYLFILLMIIGTDVSSQESGYLTNRIKPGDIMYLDGGGQERFVDYRQWDQDNPLGEVLGVVFYSYYGTVPNSVEGTDLGWHGWVVETGESDSCQWAPTGSLCYDSCVASYSVEGIMTPWNPVLEIVSFGVGDTCGWQNTKRMVEFIYSKSGVISDLSSPALHYIYSEKNGIVDFSQKPPVRGNSWYLPSYGQLRMLYGVLGCINTAMAACGGKMFSQGAWHSSTEVSTSKNAVWIFQSNGYTPTVGWLKHYERLVRAVRNF